MEEALDQNQAARLDSAFVGVARDKLAETIGAQDRIGIHTRYQDRSHDLQVVFYSPEGLSIEMTDTVEYQQQIFDKDKVLATKIVRQRYVVVLTPSEVRWQVRIFQASSPTELVFAPRRRPGSPKSTAWLQLDDLGPSGTSAAWPGLTGWFEHVGMPVSISEPSS